MADSSPRCVVGLFLAGIALGCSAGPPGALEASRDPFVQVRALLGASEIDRLVTDMRLGKQGVEAQLLRWLGTHPSADVSQRRDGWLALCAARFREQRFAEAISACEHGDALRPGSARQVIALLAVLNQARPMRWSVTGHEIPTRGGRKITVTRNGVSVEAMIDTGAEVAFVSESVARRLGGRPLDGTAVIGTTTTPVAGSVVVFDALDIAGAQLLNVTAVVLSDEQSAYAELTLTLSLPVVTSMRRAAYLDHGQRLVLGDAAPNISGSWTPLYWDESGVGFAVDLAGERRGVHLDTGSQRTWLFPAALPALSVEERETRIAAQRTIGGLGGERTENASKLRNVTLTIANSPWRFEEIEMAESDENGEAARIGTGIFDRFETVILDFERMQMSVGNRRP